MIRTLTTADLGSAMHLSVTAGWNQTAEDWRLMIEQWPRGCFAVVRDGRVVGSVCALHYADEVGWIGMMLVDPAYRRQGIATRLMNRALEHLADQPTIMLDATRDGQPVYRRLGFEDVFTLTRWTCDACRVDAGLTQRVRPMAAADLDAATELDRRIFGAKRRMLLSNLFTRAPQCAAVVWDDDLAGYVLGRPGRLFHHIGPVVADSHERAGQLVRSAMRHVQHLPLVIDVLDEQVMFADELSRQGFSRQRSFTRMVRGRTPPSDAMGRTFAIVGPEFG